MRTVRALVPVGFLLAVCAMPGQTQEKKAFDSAFYPLRVGNYWRYKATVGDAPVQKVLITVDQQEFYDYKYMQDKKEVTEPIVRFRLKIVSGSKELTEHVAVLKDGVYRFSTAGKEITPPLCFLKLVVPKGASWPVDSTSENVPLQGTFSWSENIVKVPGGLQTKDETTKVADKVAAGEVETRHVSSQDFQLGADKMALEYWFAPNVGIVRQKVRVGNSDVLLELEDFKVFVPRQ